MNSQSVEILLATYRPNLNFLTMQLESLNKQDYPNLYLSVRDDSVDDLSFASIESKLKTIITAFPYALSRNRENVGSNSTFELLTKEATGDWVAYCDQDDEWLPEKISTLVEIASRQEAVLAYSDLSIIDVQNRQTYGSFRAMNPRLKHMEGKGLFDFFLRRNSVTGCTMLLRTDIAQRALPFEKEHFVHDHWLALFASSIGHIAYNSKPLIRYRIHDSNQIGNSILRGISDKNDYLKIRLSKEKDTYLSLLIKKRFGEFEVIIIENKLHWVIDREDFFKSPNLTSFIRILKSLPQDPQLMLFEIFIAIAPPKIGRFLLKKMQR